MCFGSGTPAYTKKDYGPLPSLGTGRTDETPVAPAAVEAPVTRGGGGSSSTLDETIARAQASRNANSSIDDQRAARTSSLRRGSTYKSAPKKKSLFSLFGFN